MFKERASGLKAVGFFLCSCAERLKLTKRKRNKTKSFNPPAPILGSAPHRVVSRSTKPPFEVRGWAHKLPKGTHPSTKKILNVQEVLFDI